MKLVPSAGHHSTGAKRVKNETGAERWKTSNWCQVRKRGVRLEALENAYKPSLDWFLFFTWKKKQQQLKTTVLLLLTIDGKLLSPTI